MGSGSILGALSAQTNLLQARQDSMVKQMNLPRSATDDAKIEKGSKEFEAVLLGSWLQQAEQSFATVPGADDDQDPGGQQMMSLGVQTLATSLADSGGIGIAAMISKAMHANVEKANVHAASPADPPETERIHQKKSGAH